MFDVTTGLDNLCSAPVVGSSGIVDPTVIPGAPDRIYVDHGLTGTNRGRPGPREAMAACRAGETLVLTKLDRLTRSLPDARDIIAELTARKVALSLGGSVHEPTDPSGTSLS